jgi:methionyl-tRNA formyltransferase
MKIIFAGTPEFALPSLTTLLNSTHEICAIYTQPDRPAGRGQKLKESPVKQLALANNLPIFQPATLKNPEEQQKMLKLGADVFVDVAYGLLLPEAVLNIPKFGCVNIHPSLLPRFRGAAPIQRAILAGDSMTGVTIMQMDVGLDTGSIYKQEPLPITNHDTSETLMKKAADLGAELLLKVLTEIENGTAKLTPQTNERTTYANKITKEEGKIDWQKSASEIERMIRAFISWPIAYTEIENNYIRVWEAEVKNDNDNNSVSNITAKFSPGIITSATKNGIDVATGNGILRLLKVQFPGGKPLAVGDILNAHQEVFAAGKKLQ